MKKVFRASASEKDRQQVLDGLLRAHDEIRSVTCNTAENAGQWDCDQLPVFIGVQDEARRIERRLMKLIHRAREEMDGSS